MSTTSRQTTRAFGGDAVAYLLVREGNAWRDVFRLTPRQVTTIGRAPTNRIVVRDDVCSRNHCEIFRSGSQWMLRDLGSRNGTLVDGKKVERDCELHEGSLIQIGSYDLRFSYDLSDPLPTSEPARRIENDTELAIEIPQEGPSTELEPRILGKKRRSRYQLDSASDSGARDRTSDGLARLYKLALDMGAAKNAADLAEVVLDGVFAGTSAKSGGVLLMPGSGDLAPTFNAMRLVASRSLGEHPYQIVSENLAEVVIAEREAVLGREIDDDSRLATRDSLGRIHARSVICAPVVSGDRLFGLIHLYATKADAPLENQDLDFTLALADQFAVALDNQIQRDSLAAGLARMKDENQTLREQLQVESELVGESPPMMRVREKIDRIAPTDATVLVRGESGVGKELVARAIHFNSPRARNPFICMNCAALSEGLLESELFGHEKGSFTGAVGRTVGKFEQAHTGSLFLDEVGEMSLSVQAKFLRALEGHPFERVGGKTPIRVNVRVIAATNRPLEEAVQEGSFRKDLYFRLHVVELKIPPLRDRPDDISRLAEHFLLRVARKSGRATRGFTDEAMTALRKYSWPGNVRELQNAVERAVILGAVDSQVVTLDDIELSGLSTGPTPRTNDSGTYRAIDLDSLEREHILATLRRTKGNKSRAAQILGIERSTLDRKLKRYTGE